MLPWGDPTAALLALCGDFAAGEWPVVPSAPEKGLRRVNFFFLFFKKKKKKSGFRGSSTFGKIGSGGRAESRTAEERGRVTVRGGARCGAAGAGSEPPQLVTPAAVERELQAGPGPARPGPGRLSRGGLGPPQPAGQELGPLSSPCPPEPLLPTGRTPG